MIATWSTTGENTLSLADGVVTESAKALDQTAQRTIDDSTSQWHITPTGDLVIESKHNKMVLVRMTNTHPV